MCDMNRHMWFGIEIEGYVLNMLFICFEFYDGSKRGLKVNFNVFLMVFKYLFDSSVDYMCME